MNIRIRLLVILAGTLLVVGVFTFPLWQPLFTVKVVDETFPGLNSEEQLAFSQLPQDQQDALSEMLKADATMAVAMAKAATNPDDVVPTVEQAMPQGNNPTIIADGQFTEIDVIHMGTGKATIYELPNSKHVLRVEDFRVTNGPDLHVILTRNGEPRKAEEIGTDYIDLGLLKGNVGSQNYDIPSEVSFEVYKGVVIYCVQYSVIFTSAELS